MEKKDKESFSWIAEEWWMDMEETIIIVATQLALLNFRKSEHTWTWRSFYFVQVRVT